MFLRSALFTLVLLVFSCRVSASASANFGIPTAASSHFYEIETALDRYVQAPDAAFTYDLVEKEEAAEYMRLTFNMTSQRWLSSAQVSRSLWFHTVHVIVPRKPSNGTLALLGLDDGNNAQASVMIPVQPIAVNAAVLTGAIVIDVKQLPNEPIIFANDPTQKARTEDDIIAYSWHQYMETLDPEWIAFLPMVKAAVKAMDMVQEVLPTYSTATVPSEFFVLGWSKRAWATWLTAAVDKRVAGIAPTVIDVLRMRPSFEHIYESYGFWPPALHDYVNDNVTRDLYTEQFSLLERIVDPISYRDRLTMPKFLVDSSGDQFFPPDTITVGYDSLIGPTYYRSVPNENHFMIHSDGVWNAVRFFQSMVEEQAFPQLTWDIQYSADGLQASIVAKVSGDLLPQEARLWQATNDTSRDFRLGIGPLYSTRALLPSPVAGRRLWTVDMSAPPAGFTAFYIELSFGHVRYSTHVAVLPHAMPFSKPPNDPDIAPLV